MFPGFWPLLRNPVAAVGGISGVRPFPAPRQVSAFQANRERSEHPAAPMGGLRRGGSKVTFTGRENLIHLRIMWLRSRSRLPVAGLSIQGSVAIETQSWTPLVLPAISRRRTLVWKLHGRTKRSSPRQSATSPNSRAEPKKGHTRRNGISHPRPQRQCVDTGRQRIYHP
jgi:hypothetical protein